MSANPSGSCGPQISRQSKKNDLMGQRDTIREEALVTKVQLQAVKAQVLMLFKKIEKTYKKNIKRAAKRIVNEGKADKYLDVKSDSSSTRVR